MSMSPKSSLHLFTLSLIVLIVAVGCAKTPNDAQISNDIQTKWNADSGLAGKQLAIQSAAGTVTITGTVDNDAQREAAARYASAEPGVKQVVNNLTVQPAAGDSMMMSATPTPAP